MSTRQSTRIIARTEAALSKQSQADCATPEKLQQPASSTSRKRQKIATASRKSDVAQAIQNEKGKSRAEYQYCLTQMPLDILLGIFSELKPIDLHHLLRVSRDFHDFLWLNTTTHVWRAAYENLSWPHRPPPCPPGVNIIHYTNFLFGSHCQFCASDSTSQLNHDTGFVRLCSKCVKKWAISARDKVDESVRGLCYSWPLKNYEIYILKAEYKLRQKEMAQATKENTLSKYVEQRQAAVIYRSQEASGLVAWRHQLTQHVRQELANIRTRRRQAIQNRLRNEACVPQHLHWRLVYGFEFPHIEEPHALTDDEWRRIRADTIEYLFDHSENLERDSITTQLKTRIEALDTVLKQLVVTRPRIFPTVFHVASSDPFSIMVKSNTLMDQGVDVVLKQVAQLPGFITEWRQKTDQYLASFIPRSQRQKKDDNMSLLELATTFFQCDMCAEPISYPRILMHDCFLRPSGAIAGPNHNAQGSGIRKEKKRTSQDIPREPRPFRVITADTLWPRLSEKFGAGMHPGRAGVAFHKEASQSARRIILSCDENPDTITYAEMDQKDMRVQCLRCSSASKGKLVMRWTIAILHDLKEHMKKPSPKLCWQLVDSDEDVKKIKEKEAQTTNNSNAPYCRHCDQPVKTRLIAHLLNEHSLTANRSNVFQHFYQDIDLTMAVPPSAVRVRTI